MLCTLDGLVRSLPVHWQVTERQTPPPLLALPGLTDRLTRRSGPTRQYEGAWVLQAPQGPFTSLNPH